MISRSRALASVAIAAVGTFALASLVWFEAPVALVVGESRVTVSGTGAAPVIGALLLVLAAGLLAYLLARGILARVVAGFLTVASIGILLACIRALGDPLGPLTRLAADVSGVGQLAGEVTATPWGWATTALALVLVLASIALALAPVPARTANRFEREGAARPPTTEPAGAAAAGTVADWDALTRGEDPSG